MTGDCVNDVLALKEADLGIAMTSAAPATKAVARLVLLDGRFSRLPGVVAEGRRVIANIERVSKLFLSKTAYSIAIAVSFGLLNLQFPFLPRQLPFTDGLTIGIPSFFLALMANTSRYRPGGAAVRIGAGSVGDRAVDSCGGLPPARSEEAGAGARDVRQSPWSCSTCRSPRTSSISRGRRRTCCGQPARPRCAAGSLSSCWPGSTAGTSPADRSPARGMQFGG